MSHNKKHLLLQEHFAVGKGLHRSWQFLFNLTMLISKRYPLSGRAYILAEKARKSFEALRSELDNCVFREHSEIGDEATQIYFPDDSRKSVDDQAARELAAHLIERLDAARCCDVPEERSIERELVEALAKYNVTTIRYAFDLFSQHELTLRVIGEMPRY